MEWYLSVLPFSPKYRLGHPDKYLILLSKNTFIRSKHQTINNVLLKRTSLVPMYCNTYLFVFCTHKSALILVHTIMFPETNVMRQCLWNGTVNIPDVRAVTCPEGSISKISQDGTDFGTATCEGMTASAVGPVNRISMSKNIFIEYFAALCLNLQHPFLLEIRGTCQGQTPWGTRVSVCWQTKNVGVSTTHLSLGCVAGFDGNELPIRCSITALGTRKVH